MKHKTVALSCLLCVASCIPVFSQNAEDLVSKYGEENGKGYMQPAADVFGATFNSGLFHSAAIKKLGFQAYLGVVTTAAFIPDKRKVFMATTEGDFTPVQTAEAPTILGAAESVEVSGEGGTVYVFPGGLNISMVPFAMPQLSIGSLYGTDVTVRFFALSLSEDVGNLNLFAIGIRHSISQYFEGFPLDLALGGYYNRFVLGDLVESSSWLISGQASKSLKFLTFYGALGYENATFDLQYDQETEDAEIAFELKGSNTIRFTAGVTFNLGPLRLNVDYSLASQQVLTAGLGFAIGE